MYVYLGDIPAGVTFPFFFPAYDSNGASVTISGLAVTDIEIYKGTSMTQRSSDNGFALIDTDGIDLDSTTGIHGFSVDFSDNSDSGFYAAGSFYNLVVNAITIDSQTVRFIFAFRLCAAEGTAGYPSVDVRNLTVASSTTLATGTHNPQSGDAFARLGAPAGASVSADVAALPASILTLFSDDLGTAQAGASGTITLRSGAVATDDYYNGAVVCIYGGTGAGQSRKITDYTGSTKVATLDSNWTTNPDNTSTYFVIGRIT